MYCYIKNIRENIFIDIRLLVNIIYSFLLGCNLTYFSLTFLKLFYVVLGFDFLCGGGDIKRFKKCEIRKKYSFYIVSKCSPGSFDGNFRLETISATK